MDWELIMIELLVALMVLFVIALAFMGFLWLWWVFCGDLVQRKKRMEKGRKWEDEENE